MKTKEDRQYFAYLHCSPDVKVPFYSGKGFGTRELSLSGRNDEHLGLIAKYGGIRNLHIIKYPVASNEAALELEAELIYILCHIMGIHLVNRTSGGQDGTPSEATVELIRAKMKGRKPAPQTIEAVKKSLTGSKRSQKAVDATAAKNRGKVRTPETIENMSSAQRGRRHTFLTPEQHIAIGALLRGRKQPREAVEKASAARRGQKRTPEQVKNISDGHMGQIAWNKGISPSQESREKMRLSHLGKKLSEESQQKRKKTFAKKRFQKMMLANLAEISYDPRCVYEEGGI